MTRFDIEKIRTLSRDCATILGGAYHDDPNDTWRGRMTLDRVTYIFDQWSGKGSVTAWLMREDGARETKKAGEIGCDFSRGADAIAREISRRLIPTVVEFTKKQDAAWRAESDKIRIVVGKAESLRRKYPELKINVRDDQAGILVSTKYGAPITLDGYVYLSTIGGKSIWTLTADYGRPNFRIEDIDSPWGVAVLKLINKG